MNEATSSVTGQPSGEGARTEGCPRHRRGEYGKQSLSEQPERIRQDEDNKSNLGGVGSQWLKFRLSGR